MTEKIYNCGGKKILPIPVLDDNFVYLVFRKKEAILVDVGAAEPVIEALARHKLKLEQIFITHHHYDHVGGFAQMQEYVVDGKNQKVSPVEVIATPGHMKEHDIFYLSEAKSLFTGDTLINGGCGKLLGGTAEQLFNSLQKICELPDDTLIFGGHDYLHENMKFALAMSPNNPDMLARLNLYEKDPMSALFVTLAEEKKTNPFLHVKSIEAFAELRKLKDSFAECV